MFNTEDVLESIKQIEIINKDSALLEEINYAEQFIKQDIYKTLYPKFNNVFFAVLWTVDATNRTWEQILSNDYTKLLDEIYKLLNNPDFYNKKLETVQLWKDYAELVPMNENENEKFTQQLNNLFHSATDLEMYESSIKLFELNDLISYRIYANDLLKQIRDLFNKSKELFGNL